MPQAKWLNIYECTGCGNDYQRVHFNPDADEECPECDTMNSPEASEPYEPGKTLTEAFAKE